MLEPYEEEDLRQKRWDDYTDTLPECTCCGGRILPGQRMLKYEDIILCEDCLAEATDIYERDE